MIGYVILGALLIVGAVVIFKKKDLIKRRASAVKTEAIDVIDAIVEVGNQGGDLPKAARGEKRKGRKQK